MRSTTAPRIQAMTIDDAGRIERVLAGVAGVTLFLGLAYVLGMSGIAGDAMVAAIDWLVAHGYVQIDGPTLDASLRLLHA